MRAGQPKHQSHIPGKFELDNGASYCHTHAQWNEFKRACFIFKVHPKKRKGEQPGQERVVVTRKVATSASWPEMWQQSEDRGTIGASEILWPKS